MNDSVFKFIQSIDYTVIIARDMDSMRRFYEDLLGFEVLRQLSENWIEYQIGQNILALSRPGHTASDEPVPVGTASLQLAFRVSAQEVDECAELLIHKGVSIVSPPTNQDFGHRTLFFRDVDGNLLEIYAEI